VSGLNFWERQVLGAIADALGPDSAILVGNAFTSYMKVKDTNFSETFAAVPENGWYFEKWNAGDSLQTRLVGYRMRNLKTTSKFIYGCGLKKLSILGLYFGENLIWLQSVVKHG
jgi:hypothetical protein